MLGTAKVTTSLNGMNSWWPPQCAKSAVIGFFFISSPSQSGCLQRRSFQMPVSPTRQSSLHTHLTLFMCIHRRVKTDVVIRVIFRSHKSKGQDQFQMEIMFISSETRAAGCNVGADVAASEVEPGMFFHLWNMLHWMRSLEKSTFLLFTSHLLRSVTLYFLLLWFFKLVHRSRSERFCCQLFKRRLMSFFFFNNGLSRLGSKWTSAPSSRLWSDTCDAQPSKLCSAFKLL